MAAPAASVSDEENQLEIFLRFGFVSGCDLEGSSEQRSLTSNWKAIRVTTCISAPNLPDLK